MAAPCVSEVGFRPLVAEDYPAVAEIYRQGIESGNATFETEVPDWESWNAGRSPECRLVAETGGEVMGYAALSPVSGRCVYGGVREAMIYVAAAARGQGIGKRLLQRLVEESEAHGIWTLQAGIFPENAGSIRIFEKAGFKILGTHERLGRFHDGRWRDVVLMERRSSVTGVG
ncbi:MAG: GNAT family N-acetyltransferase [Gemmatimonadota bacterium]|nr:GNAT family N-acetyltransferase [Gemmatimonadota bacterium]MDE2864958.1 GNAT family N-acetyltransferase [Gemmatimonadota bacterium]MYE16071.1 N-acetyltransferase family protein [Gemmatimonadota bacterium]